MKFNGFIYLWHKLSVQKIIYPSADRIKCFMFQRNPSVADRNYCFISFTNLLPFIIDIGFKYKCTHNYVVALGSLHVELGI